MTYPQKGKVIKCTKFAKKHITSAGRGSKNQKHLRTSNVEAPKRKQQNWMYENRHVCEQQLSAHIATLVTGITVKGLPFMTSALREGGGYLQKQT